MKVAHVAPTKLYDCLLADAIRDEGRIINALAILRDAIESGPRKAALDRHIARKRFHLGELRSSRSDRRIRRASCSAAICEAVVEAVEAEINRKLPDWEARALLLIVGAEHYQRENLRTLNTCLYHTMEHDHPVNSRMISIYGANTQRLKRLATERIQAIEPASRRPVYTGLIGEQLAA